MATNRMEMWDVADFERHFKKAAKASSDPRFKEKFRALAGALEPVEAEFLKETAGCGRNLASALEEVRSIAARMGYCRRPRGFGEQCESLYRDVDDAVSRMDSLRETCFV